MRKTNRSGIRRTRSLQLSLAFILRCVRPAPPTRKGSVENLVKYVKGNFLLGRRFHDDLDLEQEKDEWLHSVNHVRTSQATEQIPAASGGRMPPLRTTAGSCPGLRLL